MPDITSGSDRYESTTTKTSRSNASTESLMSEFESIDAETREAAIAEAAANELARRLAEEAKRADEQVDSFDATSPPVPGAEKKNETGN